VDLSDNTCSCPDACRQHPIKENEELYQMMSEINRLSSQGLLELQMELVIFGLNLKVLICLAKHVGHVGSKTKKTSALVA